MSTATYLKKFFDEKQISFTTFEIQHGGTVHYVDTDVVIDAIRVAPRHEQEAIVKTLRRIDFVNGSVVDFLRHLATCMIKTQYPA